MFGFTDLEERLLGPDGPDQLRATVGDLRALREQVQAKANAGVSADDFETAQLVLAAINAAERILFDSTHLKGAPR